MENDIKAAISGIETEEQERRRFQMELEFVQSLANHQYLLFLSQNRYFEDPRFVRYLKYLLYWKSPKYVYEFAFTWSLIHKSSYTQCLPVLEALQNPKFRSELAHPEFSEYIDEQQRRMWLFGPGDGINE